MGMSLLPCLLQGFWHAQGAGWCGQAGHKASTLVAASLHGVYPCALATTQGVSVLTVLNSALATSQGLSVQLLTTAQGALALAILCSTLITARGLGWCPWSSSSDECCSSSWYAWLYLELSMSCTHVAFLLGRLDFLRSLDSTWLTFLSLHHEVAV